MWGAGWRGRRGCRPEPCWVAQGIDHGEFTGNNKPSATVLAFTVIANEPGNGAENPFTEAEVQAVAAQLEEDDVIMILGRSIFPLI